MNSPQGSTNTSLDFNCHPGRVFRAVFAHDRRQVHVELVRLQKEIKTFKSEQGAVV